MLKKSWEKNIYIYCRFQDKIKEVKEKKPHFGRQRAVIPTWHLKVGWESILNIWYIVNDTQEYKIDRILKLSTTRFFWPPVSFSASDNKTFLKRHWSLKLALIQKFKVFKRMFQLLIIWYKLTMQNCCHWRFQSIYTISTSGVTKDFTQDLLCVTRFILVFTFTRNWPFSVRDISTNARDLFFSFFTYSRKR